MRITTDIKAALQDKGNRATALSEIMRQNHADNIKDTPIEDIAQWIDDVIIEWVAEYKQEIAEGRHP